MGVLMGSREPVLWEGEPHDASWPLGPVMDPYPDAEKIARLTVRVWLAPHHQGYPEHAEELIQKITWALHTAYEAGWREARAWYSGVA